MSKLESLLYTFRQLLAPEDDLERAQQLYDAFFESEREALSEDEEIKDA
jgi:hypothetical protein